ncbi:peptidase S41 [Pedobacter yulinensis]|uniref:Peptidase S41 n=1 Tax=Pedobacter yulinensis TaxID=2126353 RepID=A0A2T3HRY6_9SPHI|nr:S41 family peptidase [Pedobacter yulinensis]PST85230.1 peptidase S41 [Pedobacter yulinensis]
MKKSRSFVFAVLLLGVSVLSWTFREDLFLVSKNLDIFASVYKEINMNYVDETNSSALMRTGIDAMLESLDPYTEYVPESEVEDYKLKYVSAQYGGIGASTVFIEGKLYINDISAGYPANRSDLRSGDQLVRINNVPVQGKDRTEISRLLRGPKGSPVNLMLIRDGNVISKTLTRDEIHQPNVSYAGMLADGVGYIRLDKFLENSAREVREALAGIMQQQPRGLVLDLRNNGGGILQEAVKIVNLFVNKDILVVTQKGKNPEKTIAYKTYSPPVDAQLPLVILINGNSASASEIVAGAMQDLDRGVVIGQRSYGKGLVQQTFNLPYNSLVKVTVAKYYTPSGRCIQALDYAHRKAGRASRFADSAMSVFQTSSGRQVYDANGIYPDVYVPARKVSPVTVSLFSKNLFFTYANSYKKSRPAPADAKGFKLSDAEYNEFVATLADKDYSYTSKTENLLSGLAEEAEKENKLAQVKADLDDLKTKLLGAKKTDLVTNKAEIKRVLESQIIARYFYEKGKIEQSFQYDKELQQAMTILNNKPQVLAILKGSGNYKTIGKPGKGSELD